MARYRVKQERVKHQDAFEIYYAMGDGRTLAKVALAIGVPLLTMQSWSRSFGWVQRVKDRDERLREYFSMANETRLLAIKKRFLGVIEAAIDKATVYHEDGITVKKTKIRAVTPSDVEKLVKSHALLSGEATERVGIPKDTKFIVEFK